MQGQRSHETKTYLEGNRLSIARFVWLGIALLLMGVYIAALPAFIQWLFSDPYQFNSALVQIGLNLTFFAYYSAVFNSMLVLSCLAIALLIFWRKSRDWMGLLVSLGLICFSVMLPVVPALEKIYPAWAWIVISIRYVAILIVLLIFYLFPDGRFVPPWTKFVILFWFIVFSAMLFLGLIPPATPNDVTSIKDMLALLILLIALVTGVYAQIYRYMHVTDAVERQQTKWVVFGLSAVCAGLAIISVPVMFFPALRSVGMANFAYTMFNIPASLLLWFMLPLSMGISIIRYRLWEIDLIIRRTLLYLAVTVTLVAVYFAGVVLLQALFQAVAGQKSEIAIIISTLAIATLFNPLRRRIQKDIDRRFYHSKYDAQKALESFAARMREDVVLDQLTVQLLEVVSDTMKPEHISLWMRQSGR